MKDISQLIQERNELLKSHIAGQFIKADKPDGHWVTSEETGKHIFIGADGQPKYTREQIEGGSGSLGGVADEPSEDKKDDIKDSKMTVSKLEDKSKEELLDLKKDKESAIKNPKTHPNVVKFHQEGLDKINKLLDSDKHKEEKMDKYSKELSNRISEGKLTETEGMLIKTAFKREKPVDPDKIIETANKIAKHDKSDNRKIEHVAEALFFEMERDHPHFGRAELSDFEGESKTAREAAFHRLERMNELGLLHEEGKKDISLLKEYDKKVKQLDPVSRTLLNAYLSKTVFSNVDKEDGLGRDAMEHAISILNDTLNDKNTNKDQQVSVLANHLSNRLEKEKEGNIKNAKPINKDIKITNVAPLEKIVKESKTVKEAFDKIRQVKNVSSETARQFREKYDPENNLTMMDSFERFYNDVKGSK